MLRHKGLRGRLATVGYFPEIIGDVIELALAGETPVAFHVHPDVAFGHGTIGRHLSVLVLTATRLIVLHADDHAPDEAGPAAVAASTEAIALSEVKAVSVSHIFAEPDAYRPQAPPTALRVAISWGVTRMLDAEPVACPDPECVADHGLTGTITTEDISLSVNAEIAGQEAANDLRQFAAKLSRATAAPARFLAVPDDL
ncbi:MAG: DUF5998 family protein [Bifidobacteriaceae bacterium]|jgi:hypothetical protein|nr:DUF5998 family protein [Bifidobacteriaceae bacterium]